MKFESLLIICISVLLQLQMGATMPMGNALQPSVYAQARSFNLDEEIVNNMRLNKKPWIVTETKPNGGVIRHIFELSHNERLLSRSTQVMFPQYQGNLEFLCQWQSLSKWFNDFDILQFGSQFIPFGVDRIPQNCPCPGYPCLNEQDERNLGPQDVPKGNERVPHRDSDYDRGPPNPASPQRPVAPTPTLKPPTLDNTEPIWVPVPDPTTTERSSVPLPTTAPKGKGSDPVIDDFLAKVDLTVADIKEEDGQLVTTITDKQGRVLSVSFALSENDKGQPRAAN
ncbi:uncharacterized protein LOC6528210 [Drosophila yakuba]|nr:uncharacterized protein LOC6528210 [Drosophila yakuba]